MYSPTLSLPRVRPPWTVEETGESPTLPSLCDTVSVGEEGSVALTCVSVTQVPLGDSGLLFVRSVKGN